MTPRPLHLLLSCLALGFAPVLAAAQATAAAPPPSPESRLPRLAADEQLEKREYGEAIKLYKKANKASESRCTLCLMGLAKAYTALGAHRDAAESAEAALRLTEDPELQAIAWNQLAVAQFALAGKDAEKLRLAESSFRKVLTLVPDAMTHFNLGVTLLRLNRDEEGAAELRIFLEKSPTGAKAKTAKDMLENPRRAERACCRRSSW